MTKKELIAFAHKAGGNCQICYAADFCPYFLSTGALCICHIEQVEKDE